MRSFYGAVLALDVVSHNLYVINALFEFTKTTKMLHVERHTIECALLLIVKVVLKARFGVPMDDVVMESKFRLLLFNYG